MEKIWAYIYSSLGSDSAAVQTEDHPVLLTEAVQNPVSNRQKAAEVLFESFSVPALYVPQQATLSLYASGRTSGLVLNCGDGVTHAVPIVNGFALPHATTRVDYGGRDVTERLQLLLRTAGYAFHTSSEKESVRMMKEAKVRVISIYRYISCESFSPFDDLPPPLTSSSSRRRIEQCYVAFNPSKEERYQREEQQRLLKDNYELPDGRVLQVAAERFRAPELLFDPALIGLEFPGVHRVLVETIFKGECGTADMLKNIILNANPAHSHSENTKNTNRSSPYFLTSCHSGPRLAQAALRRSRAGGRFDTLSRLWRPALERGPEARPEGSEDPHQRASGASAYHVARRLHPRLSHLVQAGARVISTPVVAFRSNPSHTYLTCSPQHLHRHAICRRSSTRCSERNAPLLPPRAWPQRIASTAPPNLRRRSQSQ